MPRPYNVRDQIRVRTNEFRTKNPDWSNYRLVPIVGTVRQSIIKTLDLKTAGLFLFSKIWSDACETGPNDDESFYVPIKIMTQF